MSYATKKQLDYAQQIANKLGKQLPKSKDFYSIKKFIQDNRQDYFKAKDAELRNNICANVSILTIASEIGFTVRRVGAKYYTLKEHDSVRIDPSSNCYWQNSVGTGVGRAEGGSVIDFLQNFTGKDYASIVMELSGRVNIDSQQVNRDYEKISQQTEIPREVEEMILPTRASNMRRVYAYLINTRGIDPDIVQNFVDRRMLYQDDRGNCVFVSRDNENTPIFACRRGTNTEIRFVGDVANSNYSKGFYIDNHANKLIVTESVIDAMSVMDIIKSKGMDYHKYNYLPLAGAAKFECVINQLKEHPSEKVFLALDNDEAGIENMGRIEKLIKQEMPDFDIENGIEECLPEYTKDWNEEIKYAFQHSVDKSALDFFNQNSNDKMTEKIKEQLKTDNKEKNGIEFTLDLEEELEI